MHSILTDVLIHLSDAVGNAETLHDIYDASIAGLRQATGVERASILLFDPDGVMRFKAWHGLSDDYRAAVEGHTPWAQGCPPPDPLIVPDVSVDATLRGYLDLFARERIAALAFVPIISRRQVVGKFMLYSDVPREFSRGEIAAALTIGYQIGFAVDRMRALKEEEETRERLTALTDASERLLTSLEVDSVVNEVVALASRVLAADAYAVWRRDGPQWRVAASRDLGPAFTSEVLHDDGRVRFDRPLVVEDVAAVVELEHRRAAYAREGIQSMVGIPVNGRGEAQASLVLYYRMRYRPSELEVRVAAALGQLAASAISNARLFTAAQEANRVKDEFLATLSHELRTPLNVILGRTLMLRAAHGGDTAAAEAIERNALLLARLVDDLLDVSRFTLGQVRLDPQPLSLEGLALAVVAGLEPTARARAITLRLERPHGDVSVVADPTRLQQVLWNLLTNALKFTPAGGDVLLVIDRTPSQAILTVSDTGQGIASEFLPHVFEMFRQAESTSNRHHGGLGVGLSIVRRLVELHGGTVHAESAGIGRGTTFTVTLPLAVSSPAAAGISDAAVARVQPQGAARESR